MILAPDPGLCDLGWSVVAPRTGRVAEVGQLHQDRDPELDESTCRARRLWRQAELLVAVIRRCRCTAIAAEAPSFGGPPKARFAMAISLGLSFGDLVGIAVACGIAMYQVPPKRWQHAVLGREPGDRAAVDYDEVFRRLADFIGRTGTAAEQLAAIPPGRRNHALDSVGVGVFAALRPEQATRIGGPT